MGYSVDDKPDVRFIVPNFANSIEIKASPFEVKISYMYKQEQREVGNKDKIRTNSMILLGEFIISPEHARLFCRRLTSVLAELDEQTKSINEETRRNKQSSRRIKEYLLQRPQKKANMWLY